MGVLHLLHYIHTLLTAIRSITALLRQFRYMLNSIDLSTIEIGKNCNVYTIDIYMGVLHLLHYIYFANGQRGITALPRQFRYNRVKTIDISTPRLDNSVYN